MDYKVIIVVLVMAMFFTACESERVQPESTFLPYAFPGNVGADPVVLENMNELIKEGFYDNIEGVIIIKNDRVIFENYYNGHSSDDLMAIGEATQGVFSLGFNLILNNNELVSRQSNLIDLFPGYADNFVDQPFKDQINVEHLLAYRSGLEWNEWEIDDGVTNDLQQMLLSDDYVDYVLSKGLIGEPGLFFEFNSGHFYLMENILRTSTDMTIDQYFENTLFSELSINRYRWSNVNDSTLNVLNGLALKPMDWAKIGYLVLNDGNYKSKQIFEPGLLSYLSQRNGFTSYYQFGRDWWKFFSYVSVVNGLQTNDLMFIRGDNGQYLMVVPHLSMVVVIMGNMEPGINEFPLIILRDQIIPAVNSVF